MVYKRGSVALALVAMGALAGLGRVADAATLDTLLSGASFTVGNATYSNFQYDDLADASSVVVTASTAGNVSTIAFTRSGAPWSATDDHGVVQFDVSFATPIISTGLDFSATQTGDAAPNVSETILDGVTGAYYGSPLGPWVHTGGGVPSVFSDSYTFDTPVSSLSILKSIDVGADTGTGTITMVDNTYTAVPEPASLSLLGLGAMVLIRRRRRSAA